MFAPFALGLFVCLSSWAEEVPQVPAVTATRLPILAARLRERDVPEAELRALLETALGSGVSVSSLVEALEVVVVELEAGSPMPDLSLRLPGLIVQGFEDDELARNLRQASRSAAASVLSLPRRPPEPEPEPEAGVSR
jgi:hypothetical protein